jgi:uncharacterized protein
MKTIFEKHPLFYFFLFAFLFSWILWIPLLYGHFKLGWTSWEGNSWTNYRTMLGLLGSLGPSISAILLTYILKGKTEVKTLLKSVINWRVNISWWLIALYGWWLLCSILVVVSNTAGVQQVSMGFLYSLINIPALLFFIQMPFFVGMFGEEVGWRGFALPRLLEKYNPVVASLILALPWMFWHTPLAVFQEWRGNTTLFEFVTNYFLLVVPLTLIFTWFFQKTKGSLLLIMILHKSFNLTFNSFKVALGLSESSSQIVREWSIISFVIAVYYLWFSKVKAKQEKAVGFV